MERTTYRDPKVVELIKSKYLTVRVDQDANPDLSNRYGDWGWPATIIFAPDGTELVKWRGYIPPENMASLLEAVIADPTPGPSVTNEADVVPSATHVLTKEQRTELATRMKDAYDDKFGGWGEGHKLIEPDSMDWALSEAERGNSAAAAMARQTLDAALALIDREGGGIYQYSDEADWKSPHYEKIMWFHAQGLRQYSAAYALWRDPRYLAAARNLYRYLATDLTGPNGAFFTSQDADVDERLDGKTYYAMTLAERRKTGRQPRIDKSIYARENGWAISALVALYNVTADPTVLANAERAANWVVANRAITGGGFRHGDKDMPHHVQVIAP